MEFDWSGIQAVWIEEGDGLAGYRPEFRAPTEMQHPDAPRQWVAWIEARHERVIPVMEILADEPDRLRWRDDRGREWQFRPLTLARYREHVKPHTMGKPDFASEREMLETMRREW